MTTYYFLHEEKQWTLPGEKQTLDGQIQTRTQYYKMRGQRELDREDINRLWTQLSATPHDITDHTITTVAKFSRLLIARHHNDRRIIGMATLCIKPTLHGSIGIIEDVVVDELMRGEHIGECLLIRLIDYARNVAKLDELVLTSKPQRIAANTLYQKLNFKQYEPTTNHYRLRLLL